MKVETMGKIWDVINIGADVLFYGAIAATLIYVYFIK